MEHPLANGAEEAHTHALLERHTLVWIESREREQLYARTRDEIRRDALRRWFANDWPLVVRRPDALVHFGDVALGLALPPSEGKRRLKFAVRNRAIARFSPPLRLDEATLRLSPKWAKPLAELTKQAAAHGVTLHVFGSLAWQALTGLDYLTAQSDVDLWWQAVAVDQVGAVIALIASWERRYGLRADGEMVFASGAAVAWREWQASASDSRVLAKRINALQLISRDALAASLVIRGAT